MIISLEMVNEMKTNFNALTTVDNPYDPFKEFDKWFVFDVVKGYNSCGYLARIATVSDQLTDEENLKENPGFGHPYL